MFLCPADRDPKHGDVDMLLSGVMLITYAASHEGDIQAIKHTPYKASERKQLFIEVLYLLPLLSYR